MYAGKEYGPVEFKTDYEYVTLNVREFGAYGDGEHDDTNAIQFQRVFIRYQAYS